MKGHFVGKDLSTKVKVFVNKIIIKKESKWGKVERIRFEYVTECKVKGV